MGVGAIVVPDPLVGGPAPRGTLPAVHPRIFPTPVDHTLRWFGPALPEGQTEHQETTVPSGVPCKVCGGRMRWDSQGWVVMRTEHHPLPDAYHHACLWRILGLVPASGHTPSP